MPTREDKLIAVKRRALLVLGALMMLGEPAVAQQSRPVVVFAAASLQTALKAAAAEWKA